MDYRGVCNALDAAAGTTEGGAGMSEQLKECPFCGSTDSRIHNHVVTNQFTIVGLQWFVQCIGCDVEGPSADSKEFAIEAWNKGTPRYHRVFKLEDALRRIRDCDFEYTGNWEEGMRAIAREALDGCRCEEVQG
jgi:Lar family restriction alleviation protein